MGQPAKIAVLGTGALGTLLAARLARAGHAVTFSGTWPAALQTAASDGLGVVEADDRSWQTAVETCHRRDLQGGYSLVLVLTKSFSTEDCAPAAARGRAPGGLILSLQNGLDNLEILSAIAGSGSVAGGTTDCAATLLGPAHVRAAGGGRVVLGTLPGGATQPQLDATAELLASAGLKVSQEDDLEAARWTKLAINCAINPLAALGRSTNGELVRSAPRRELLAAIAEETGRIGRRIGFDLPHDLGQRTVDCAQRTASNHCSMLQDIERGRPTEIDAICGAVVTQAYRLKMTAPLNKYLAGAVTELTRHPTLPIVDLDQLAGALL